MNYRKRINYSDIFSEKEVNVTVNLEALSEILRSSSKNFIVERMAKINYHSKRIDDDFFSLLFSNPRNPYALYYKDIFKTKELLKDECIFLDDLSLLHLLEYALSIPESDYLNNGTIAEKEQALFVSILFQNQILTNKESEIGNSIKHLDLFFYDKIAFRLILLSLPNSFINQNLKNSLYLQIIKAGILFKFLESEELYKPYYELILKEYSCDKQTLFQSLLQIGLRYIEPNIEANGNNISARIGDKILSNLLYGNNDQEMADFVNLRAEPLFRNGNGYSAFHPLFLIEKIYKGWYFEILRLNNGPNLSQASASFSRSRYTDAFSEKYLLSHAMNNCIIHDVKSKGYSEEEIVEKFKLSKNALPDYVMVEGQNILIIENKDNLIKGEMKHAYDFKEFEKEMTEKVNSEGKRKKGIPQLIKFLEKIQKEDEPWSRCVSSESKIFYPVLVLHDDVFDYSYGINYYLNKKFQEQLELSNTITKKHVKPLLVLTIDSLLVLGSILSKKEKNMVSLIEEYFSKCLENTKEQNQLSFMNFLSVNGYFKIDENSFFKSQIESLTGVKI